MSRKYCNLNWNLREFFSTFFLIEKMFERFFEAWMKLRENSENISFLSLFGVIFDLKKKRKISSWNRIFQSLLTHKFFWDNINILSFWWEIYNVLSFVSSPRLSTDLENFTEAWIWRKIGECWNFSWNCGINNYFSATEFHNFPTVSNEINLKGKWHRHQICKDFFIDKKIKFQAKNSNFD